MDGEILGFRQNLWIFETEKVAGVAVIFEKKRNQQILEHENIRVN
jgi:hypothetical protein